MAGRDLPPGLTHGPFLVSTAAQLGVSPTVLRGRRFRRVHRGVYVLSTIPDTIALRFEAARLLMPSAVASHHTSALLRSLPVPRTHPLHVTVPSAEHRNYRAGIRPHVAVLADRDVTLVHGHPATTVGRAMVEIASVTRPLERLDLVDLVALGDAAARHGWCSVEDIVEASIRATGRGCVLARRVARLVRSGVDSPMESRLRLLLVLAGLPEPVINFEIISGSGPIARPDLAYPQARIAIEYDGGHHRTDPRQWRHDKARDRLIRDEDWQLLEVIANDLFRTPESILGWVHSRLVAAAVPGTPDRLGDAWRQYWPDQRYWSPDSTETARVHGFG